MLANPEDAAAIEASINDFLSENRLHEADFNARTAAENRSAVSESKSFLAKADGNPTIKKHLPLGASHGLEVLRKTADRELYEIQRDEQGIYCEDTHYDAHLTWVWARLMQRLDENIAE